VSGRKDDRPQLHQLLAAVDRRELDVVVIPKLDRFGRSVRQLHDNFDRLDRAGVELVSLNESIDTSTSVGRLLRAVLAALAEFESDVIGERVASVTTAHAEQGKAHGRPKFGYRKAGKDGLVIVPAEEAIVQRIFREYAIEGRSQRSICRGLTSDGIRARTGEWTQGTISKLLRAPVYAGLVEVNGKTYPGKHEAIIDDGLWRKAQQLREAGARSQRGKTPTANHLLAGGMLRCGRCGGAMYAHTRPGRNGGVPWEAYIHARPASASASTRARSRRSSASRSTRPSGGSSPTPHSTWTPPDARSSSGRTRSWPSWRS
jgi:site-specific DNA recombinase